MAEMKFEKGSMEWMMFQDLYKICQKYWKVEREGKYWLGIIRELGDFIEKYEEIPFAKNIMMAFFQCQADIYDKGGGR